jgi:hypothetical protein
MKALDKVFDTQVITGIIGDKFHFIEAKENFLYEEGKKTEKKDGIKVTIVTEENPTEFLKVKVNGTLNDVSSYKLYDSIDFENLTGKFWIKTSGNYASKELSLKADGIKEFQLIK